MSVSASQERKLVFVIVGVFVVLGIFFSCTTPIFESPDEVWHYAYIREIATQHGFPIMQAGISQPWAQEGSQAPLYYLIAAPLIAWIDPTELQDLLAPNPFVRIGEPQFASNDNRNAFIHTSQEAFPFRGTALAVHLIRLLSITLGALTVTFTFLLAREIFPDQSFIAFSAAAFIAFLPQFIFISSSVNNDNLATTFATAMLWQLARTVRQGITGRRAIILGLLAGGALLAKFNTATLVPFTILVLFVIAFPKREWRAFIIHSLILGLVTALVAGWWYARSFMLYGDPSGLSLIIKLIGERPASIDLWRWFIAENEGLRLSTWGVFGWMNILAAPAFYWFFDLLALAGISGIIIALIRLFFQSKVGAAKLWAQLKLPGLVGIWCAITFAALVYYNRSLPASQGRLLFPALGAYAVLWAWGITSLVSVRFRSWVTTLFTGGQFLVAAIAPLAFIAPAYSPTLANEALTSGTSQINYKFENSFEWVHVATDKTTTRPGDSVTITLAYIIPAKNNRNIATFIHVLNSADVIIAQRDSFIGAGNPNALPASGLAADNYRIEIPITANAPDEYRVVAGIYNPLNNTRFKTTSSTPSDTVAVTALRIEPVNRSWNFDFDGRGILLNAESSSSKIARGETLVITLRWNHPNASHRVFAHVLGDNDQIWAFADLPIEREMKLNLKFDDKTPPGIYPIELGVYPIDHDRVAVYDSRNQLVGDRLFLNPIRVVEK